MVAYALTRGSLAFDCASFPSSISVTFPSIVLSRKELFCVACAKTGSRHPQYKAAVTVIDKTSFFICVFLLSVLTAYEDIRYGAYTVPEHATKRLVNAKPCRWDIAVGF